MLTAKKKNISFREKDEYYFTDIFITKKKAAKFAAFFNSIYAM
jgi:hypothetical protein